MSYSQEHFIDDIQHVIPLTLTLSPGLGERGTHVTILMLQ
jgi:hypothetical protein